jgi:hypothetical protein
MPYDLQLKFLEQCLCKLIALYQLKWVCRTCIYGIFCDIYSDVSRTSLQKFNFCLSLELETECMCCFEETCCLILQIRGKILLAEDGSGRFLKKYSPTLKMGRADSFAVLVPI